MGTFWLWSTYVATIIDVCFDCFLQNWVCFDYGWSMFGFPDQNGHILTVLNLCFDFLDLSFDCARPFFYSIFPAKMGNFWLCSTYVPTIVDVCFDFFWSKFGMFGLWLKYVSVFLIKMGIFWQCSTYISMMFDFIFSHNWVWFDCAESMYRLSWSKLGIYDSAQSVFRHCLTFVLTFRPTIFWLCSTCVLIFSIYVLTAFDLFFDFLGQK